MLLEARRATREESVAGACRGDPTMSVRISGGVFRGRVLTGPPRVDSRRGPMQAAHRTRPSAVRLRKSLFAVLAEEMAEARVLDLCAGVGTLGFEALSRGARECVFVERSPRLGRLIERNAARVGTSAFELVVGDALGELRRFLGAGREFDVAFLDPPWETWESEQGLELLRGAVSLAPLVVAEHRSSWTAPSSVVVRPEPEPESRVCPSSGVKTRTTAAGDGAFSLYRWAEGNESVDTLA